MAKGCKIWAALTSIILLMNFACTPARSKDPLLIDGGDSKNCLQAAKKELGPNGLVLRCGHLVGGKSLEAVVAVRVPSLTDDENGIPISVLLQENGSHWDILVNVNMEVMNSAGYLGFNFIDNSHPFPYYRINFTDSGAQWGARNRSEFTLVLRSMNLDGKIDPEDIGLGIGWNSAVRRFQEIEPNGEEFAPEVKNPKHIKTQ